MSALSQVAWLDFQERVVWKCHLVLTLFHHIACPADVSALCSSADQCSPVWKRYVSQTIFTISSETLFSEVCCLCKKFGTGQQTGCKMFHIQPAWNIPQGEKSCITEKLITPYMAKKNCTKIQVSGSGQQTLVPGGPHTVLLWSSKWKAIFSKCQPEW